TSLGAKYVFEDMIEDLNIAPTENYEVYTVTTSFSGTLASKSGYHGQKDTIEVYEPQGVDNDYVVFYADDQKKTTSIYNADSLKEKDQYTVFFGGNHTRIDIDSPNPDNRCLLMFKDSYANSFVQFLTPYYRKIIVIDPRYYYDNVEQIIASEKVTDVLFLYNLNTFLTDTSLADVLTPQEDTETDGQEGTTEGGAAGEDLLDKSAEREDTGETSEESAEGEDTGEISEESTEGEDAGDTSEESDTDENAEGEDDEV
ncbi:DHHW family protein, partial [Blautia hydrogenotrophica]